MATPIKDWSKLEVRAVVYLLFSRGTKPSEIHKQIDETYGEGAMSRFQVYQCCTWFGEGRISLDDEPKSGRPKTSTNEKNATRVDELIKSDRKLKIREIASKLGVPKSTVHEIVHDFHLFGPLKRHLGGMALETEDDLVGELKNWFAHLDVDFFRHNGITTEYRFVKSLKDVCDVLKIPPEYAIKVKAGIVKNDMVRECLEPLGKKDTVTVVLRASFLQKKRSLPTMQINSSEDESDPNTDSVAAQAGAVGGASSLQGEEIQNVTHWVKSVEIGNELIIFVRMSAKGQKGPRFLLKIEKKLKDDLQKCWNLSESEKVAALRKMATGIDEKLFEDDYIDHIDLAIYYCSFHELQKYPDHFEGMMDILESFINEIKAGKQYQMKTSSMTCKHGKDKKEE